MSSDKEDQEEESGSGFGWLGMGVAALVGAGIGAFLASGSTPNQRCNVSSSTSTSSSSNSEAYRNRQAPTSEPCGICLDNVLVVVRFPCGHRFHEKCVLDWITQKKTCPTCRFPTYLSELKYSA